MRTGLVDCIGHPTGRRLGHRAGAELDLERLLDEARRYGVAVELNGNPYRMDLPDVDVRRASQLGVPVCINTDAHAPEHLARQEYGLVTARRGWLEPRDVLNCQPWSVLAERRADRLRRQGLTVPLRRPEPPAAWSEPSAPEPSPHWPEVVPPTETAPERPPSDDGHAVDALADQLVAPLPDALRQRVDDWLRNGGDDELEEALARKGMPMQVAFTLLVS